MLHAVLADETIDLHLPLLAETMDSAVRGSEGRGVLGSEGVRGQRIGVRGSKVEGQRNGGQRNGGQRM